MRVRAIFENCIGGGGAKKVSKFFLPAWGRLGKYFQFEKEFISNHKMVASIPFFSPYLILGDSYKHIYINMYICIMYVFIPYVPKACANWIYFRQSHLTGSLFNFYVLTTKPHVPRFLRSLQVAISKMDLYTSYNSKY